MKQDVDLMAHASCEISRSKHWVPDIFRWTQALKNASNPGTLRRQQTQI